MKVNTSQVDPYELVLSQLNRTASKIDIEMSEIFFRDQIEKLREKGNVGSSLVMPDVSGSMTVSGSKPLATSVAMACWLSSLAAPEWRDMVLPFSSEARFYDLSDCKSLNERITKIMRCPWGMSTNLQAAFELILKKAVDHSLKDEEMVKNVFVISDMQFDVCVSPNIATNLETIRLKYRNAGYTLPHLVFWNVLGSSTNVVASGTDEGISLLGGFSKDQINCFLTGKKAKTPLAFMNATLDHERYDRMVFVNSSGDVVPTLTRTRVKDTTNSAGAC